MYSAFFAKFCSVICKTALLCVVVPAFAQTESDNEDNLWAIGTAWATDRSEILYREFHFAEDAELDLPTRVEYRTPDGTVIAEKTVDYSVDTSAPAISQTDFRNDAVIRTSHSGSDVALEFRAHDSDNLQRTTVRRRDGLIIDAGFDPFVRDNWDRLANGRRITTDFLVPARMDTVRIGISKTDDSDCDADAQQIHCFVIRPAGLLRVAGWFVDPILIAYAPDTQRLLMFHGLSNLRDDAGETRNVLIQYEYF